jgi:23S rRNA pseudouridine2605 synthase
MEERIQKILARMGHGSRRQAETLIADGRVYVNGKRVGLGAKADPTVDTITIDGERLDYQEPEKIYIALNKPRFVLSDRAVNDPRNNVFKLVPDSDSLFVVGRLDFESEGLVLLTNDGELANRLSHPRYEKEKEYKVLVAKKPDEEQLNTWRRGVVLESGEKTATAEVRQIRLQGEGAWLSVIMKEGKKREIREVCRMIGLPIVKLIRTRIGTLTLGSLKSGEWVVLNDKQVEALRELAYRRKPTPSSRKKSAATIQKPKYISVKVNSGRGRNARGGAKSSRRPARSRG